MNNFEFNAAKKELMKLIVAANIINLLIWLYLGVIDYPAWAVDIFKGVVIFQIILVVISSLLIFKGEKNGGSN